MKKIGAFCLKSGFYEKKMFKYCPNQKMTKGKMVLDLLKFVKSAMKKFDQSEASIGSHMTTMHCGPIT